MRHSVNPLRLRRLILGALLGAACSGHDEPQMSAPPIAFEIPKPNMGSPTVRVAYIIPADRTPQPQGVVHLQQAIRMIHEFYGEQMARWGHRYKTFRYETEGDGVTPKVYVIKTNRTVQWMLGSGNGYDLWERARQAALEAGATSIYGEKEIWFCVPETHVERPDSSITGTTWMGRPSADLGISNGAAFVGSEALTFFSPQACEDDRQLNGQTIPEIGPYPLTEREFGGTYSDHCGGGTNALARELGQAFGLRHDIRPDTHDLMYYGNYRGWRFPEKYRDIARLNYADSLILSTSPYFAVYKNGQPEPYTSTDAMAPTVDVLSFGVESDGKMHVRFSARDDVGLAVAYLGMGESADAVAEVVLSGTSATGELITPYYGSPGFQPGEDNTYTVYVLDASHNRTPQQVRVTLSSLGNRAPEAHVTTSPGVEARVGQIVTFDAHDSVDHDGDRGFLFEWDLNDDGIYEIGPSTSPIYTASFSKPGVVRVRARVTDTHGASSTSVPIALRITDDCNKNGVADSRDILDGTSADANGDWIPDECAAR